MQRLHQCPGLWAFAVWVSFQCVIQVSTVQARNPQTTNEEIKAGVLRAWPPQYLLGEDGRPTGFAVDIIEKIAAAEGMRVIYRVLDSWEQVERALRSGEIDLIPNLGITEERKRWADFTSPVETFPIVIFIRKSTLDISSAEDLAGHTVAAVRFNVGNRLMQQRDDIELKVYPSLEEAFFGMLAGQIDALIYPQPVLMKLAIDSGLEDRIAVAGQPLVEIKRAIAVRKDDAILLNRLEAALKTLLRSKAYGQSYARWYGRPKPFWTPRRVVVTVAAMIATIMFLGALWHYLRTAAVNRLLKESLKERKRVEEALRVSEEKYRLMVEYQHDLLVKMDSGSRILFVSPSIRELFGCTEEEIVGTSLLSLVHSQDYENVKLALQSLVVAPYFCRYEVRCLTSDGWKWVSWTNKAILDDKGGISEIIAVGRDTTQRKEADLRLKESEEKFRAIFEHAADMVLLLKRDSLELVDFNTTAHQTLGFTREEFRQVQLKDLLIVQPPDTGAEMERRILKSLRQPVESMLRTKSGRVRHFRIKQQIIKLSGVQYLLGIWLDITEQRRLEEHLVQSQKMEAIGTLAGGVAHDFNNILSIIIGNAELALQDGAGNSSLEQKLKEIQTACQRARDVVAQLLSISRQDETTCAPVLLPHVIDECMRLLRVSIPATVEIRQNICSQPLCVLSDATQVQQVLINLCTNASHAMEPDGGRLTVSLASVRLNRTRAGRLGLDAGEYARIKVEDTGTGIESAHLERIFEPYFSTKPAHLGTGMGLAMVHGIVSKYGGAITVASQPGRGARFDVFLPLSDFAEAMHAPGPVASLTGSGRLLFIDDEPSILNIGSQYLRRLGYEVHTADNANRALEMFKAKPDGYDLVITDMTMPKISGEMLVKAIRKIKPRVPVIMCTGYHDETIRRSVHSLNVKNVLQKPFPMGTLAEAVKQALNTSIGINGRRRGCRGAETDTLRTTTS